MVDIPALAACTTVYALVEGLLTYPYDVLKTVQQMAPRGSPEARLGTMGMLHGLIREGRPEDLYRGFRWNVLGGVPSEVCYYVGYTEAKRALSKTSLGQQFPAAVYFTAGLFADALSLLLYVPFDVVAQRLQLQGTAPRLAQRHEGAAVAASAAGAEATAARAAVNAPATAAAAPASTPAKAQLSGVEIASAIVRRDGVLGLWRGTAATIVSMAPHSAVWWLTHEEAKRRLAPRLGHAEGDPRVLGLSGAAAGVLSTVATNPLDVIKTRVQCTDASVPSVLRGFAAEGLGGLYRGLFPRLVAAVPRSVCTVLAYEKAVAYCTRPRAEAERSSC